MKEILLLILVLIFFVSCTPNKQEVDYVNPLIGTPFAGFKENLEGGGTMPCVGTPFAMTNFVAQTRENKMSRMVYVYEDSTVIGFTATHQPTVWMGDYGYVSVMPQIGQLKVLPEERALHYIHKDEISQPHYYSVNLQAGDKKIKGEIAAASRCGMFQFTFPQSDEAHLIIQGINLNPKLTDWANDYSKRIQTLKGYVKIDKENGEITGIILTGCRHKLGLICQILKDISLFSLTNPLKFSGPGRGMTMRKSKPEVPNNPEPVWELTSVLKPKKMKP